MRLERFRVTRDNYFSGEPLQPLSGTTVKYDAIMGTGKAYEYEKNLFANPHWLAEDKILIAHLWHGHHPEDLDENGRLKVEGFGCLRNVYENVGGEIRFLENGLRKFFFDAKPDNDDDEDDTTKKDEARHARAALVDAELVTE